MTAFCAAAVSARRLKAQNAHSPNQPRTHTRQCTLYSMYGVKEKVRRSMVFVHFSCSWWQPCLLCRIFLIFLRKINLNLIIHTVFACYMNFLYFIVYRTLFYKENHIKKYLITYQTLKLLVSKQQKIF